MVRPKRSPFHNIVFLVTAAYGHYPNGGVHNGIDLAPPNSAITGDVIIYSIVNSGYVFQTGYNESMGNFVRFKDNESNAAFTFMHLKDNSITVSVGDTLNLQTPLGIMGSTGNSTAPHLHIEERIMTGIVSPSEYVNSERTDPSVYLGIKNVYYGEEYIEYYYADNIPPEPPVYLIGKSDFKWALFKRKIN